MPLHLRDKVPNFVAPLHILKAECKVCAIRFRPYNERILLALVHISHAHDAIEKDLLRVLGARDESCFLGVLIEVALAERGPPVSPSRANKFVHL